MASCYFIRPRFDQAVTKDTRCKNCGTTWNDHYPERQHALADVTDAEVVVEETPADDHGEVDGQGSLFSR